MRKFLLVIAFLFVVAPAKANDIYISQSSTGAANGADCGNARDLSWLNTSGNWGSGASQIGPGTTVHLCGTFTAPAGASNFIVAQGSGASGNPVTIKFEPSAVLQAPYWGVVISLGTKSFITVDGGTNGLIQATGNGTSLSYHQSSGIAIYSIGGSNITVKNLTIANLYVHSCNLPITNCTDEQGDTNGVLIVGGSNQLVTGMTLHDVRWAISYAMGSSSVSNITISNNLAYHVDHGLFTTDGTNGSGSGSVTNGLYVFGNTWHDFDNWDDAANNFHHDCTHNDLTHSNSSALNVFVYNNYCYGNWGQHMNSAIYFSSQSNPYVATAFNNVLVAGTGSGLGCGIICSLAGVSASEYNNTIIGAGTTYGLGTHFYGPNSVFVNNIVMNVYEATLRSDPGVLTNIDYNTYYNIGSGGWAQAYWPQWQGQNFDLHGSVGNPNLSSTYQPTSSSATLIQKGTNLTPLPIANLNLDKAGTARPLSAKWEIGAYQYGSGSSSGLPSAPTNLVSSVQ